MDAAWLDSHPSDRAIVDQLTVARTADKTPVQLLGERLQLEARRHHDVWSRLDRVSCPTIIAAGRFDGIAPPNNAEAIASRIPGAELHVYEGGHLFIAQDRRALPDLIGFLAR